MSIQDIFKQMIDRLQEIDITLNFSKDEQEEADKIMKEFEDKIIDHLTQRGARCS